MNRVIYVLLINCFLFAVEVRSVELIAYISQHGLHGQFRFNQLGAEIEIRSELETTLQYPDQSWSWSIQEFPVDYTETNGRKRCSDDRLGRSLVSFDESLGYLILPGNESTRWLTKSIELTGSIGIWGKSILLNDPNNDFRICGTITTERSDIDHVAVARFHSPIAGSIYFRWLAAKETDHRDTLIYSNLYFVEPIVWIKPITTVPPFTNHSWKIYVTDIFDTNYERPEKNCNVLQLVYDPQDYGEGKSIGDIDERVGKIKVAGHETKLANRGAGILFRDEKLALKPTDFNGPQRQLYVVLFDVQHPDTFLACAKIRHLQPIVAKTFYNGGGVKGEITVRQRSRFEPTWLNFSISAATNEFKENSEYGRDVAGFHINTLPADPTITDRREHCQSAGKLFNPESIDLSTTPPAGFGTQDQYAIGDLSGKLQLRNKEQNHSVYIPTGSSELSGLYWDVFLPLQGPNSVVHRSVAILKRNQSESELWACSTLSLYQKTGDYQLPIFTAQILFRYPIVGRILLRQPRDEPWLDTVILIEYLIHADGAAVNRSAAHRWAIHSEPPGKDFYNWTARCLSAKQIYNPYKIHFNEKSPEHTCKGDARDLCRLGDLSNRHETLTISGRKAERKFSRTMFVDSNLPLSGRNNVLGKSFVIYDDFGPVARGERLACSIIEGYYRRKVVAKDWFPNGAPLTIKGKIEMFQQTEYEMTNVEVNLKGLIDNSGYHVHISPVDGSLEFPCEDSTVYGHWNPRSIDPRRAPPPTRGTTDQYEMGDLSGKFGTLDGRTEYSDVYNDTELPLFGYDTILGRSIVIHRKEKNARWACSTLERGYSSKEAREIRGIASFHHPAGYAYGFVRFTQLIHSDNSKSDTVIEVNLRHPGVNDRNLTRNHHWNIFVNPIGVDAAVQQTATRCVAGGYVWNPYYTQLADPLNGDLYRAECGPDNPLRCYVGDVSARLGTIDVGGKRSVFSDQNFPLEGAQSAIGRSIVLFGPNYSGERFACANIEPDHDIVKYINLQKPPKFVVAQFLDDVQHVMGLPHWMLTIDSRSTKTLHNGACIQMIVHFRGPLAHQLEKDLTRLISSGRMDSPSLSIPGYVNQKRKTKLSYKTCGVRDPNEKSTKRWINSDSTRLQFSSILLLLLPLFFM